MVNPSSGAVGHVAGKVALGSGGASGIGRATALLLLLTFSAARKKEADCFLALEWKLSTTSTA